MLSTEIDKNMVLLFRNRHVDDTDYHNAPDALDRSFESLRKAVDAGSTPFLHILDLVGACLTQTGVGHKVRGAPGPCVPGGLSGCLMPVSLFIDFPLLDDVSVKPHIENVPSLGRIENSTSYPSLCGALQPHVQCVFIEKAEPVPGVHSRGH